MSGRGQWRTTQRDDHSEQDERVIQRESTTSTVSTDGSMNQNNNAGQNAYRIPELANALKQTVSYGALGAPGFNASYQKIDVIDDSFADEINKFSSIHTRVHKTNSFGSKGNNSSNGNTKNGNGRSHTLILRFDSDGTPSLQEMSRTDVLRIAQDAARPITPTDSDEEEIGPVTSHDTTRRVGKEPSKVAPTFKRRQSRRLSDPRIPECKNIVDVQRVHARDIRKLDNAFAVSNEPSIVVRKQAILVNADPLRAVIMRDTCLVFVPDDAAGLLLLLKDKFREHTQPDASDMPFEFRALEALLATICRHFEADYEMASPGVSKALDRLACGHVSSGELEKLRIFKNTMNEFESQVDGVRRALMEILDNEEDLRLLYLTKLHEYPSLLGDLYSFDSEEAEVLIENYLQDIFSTRTKANLMQHRIQNTESLVMLKLDSMRNYLLGIELMFSLVAISLSIGTYITGAFGMNLNSHIQQDDHWFWGIVVFTIIIFMALTISGLLFFRKIGVLI